MPPPARTAALVAGLLASLVAAAAPAGAAPTAAPRYTALGDSYSSGTGTRSYLPDGTSCLRSAYGPGDGRRVAALSGGRAVAVGPRLSLAQPACLPDPRRRPGAARRGPARCPAALARWSR